MARPEYWLRLKPWSLTALFVVVACLAAAIVMRAILAEFGIPLYFTTFLPAILAAALLAGTPAGVLTAFSSVIIVWWAFIPPAFEFSPLTRAEINSIGIFSLAMAMVIWFAHLCRVAARMRKEKAA